MATSGTASPFGILASTKLSSSSSSSPIPSFPHSSLYHSYKTSHNANPRLTLCQAKLNAVEEAEEIDGAFFDGDDVIEDESDEDDTESSMDLLFRFLQSMFNKVSKRAKKASRSMLPALISPQLVSFAVDGVFLLASLSIVKALLEVVCTLGGTIFVVILLLRVIWAAISYFQSNGNNFNKNGTSPSTT
ncbi:hypothetical protein F0562_033707 [Nyssa sinensis]|uniref:Protein SHORT HYPOCOTYL IN WHITE LIGHT 1 n=1 Tax=Nyssa sinensis TaxID=561372 RepID=A0A5J5AGY7_9ASTE|nr:hypothetical protein F0562_033707 [Nyssa sinensis]